MSTNRLSALARVMAARPGLPADVSDLLSDCAEALATARRDEREKAAKVAASYYQTLGGAADTISAAILEQKDDIHLPLS